MAAEKIPREHADEEAGFDPIEAAEASDESAQQTDGAGMPVVGIAASAGGLDAFKKLIGAMPADTGIAFILIPHLDPTHESLMVELIGRQTTMPVVQAEEGLRVEPNRIYIIPPNKYMTIQGGFLRLTGPVARNVSTTPIDPFLRSLADDQQERAICIILSGTGAHGTLGLKAVKARGGMAMVQEPASAEFDRMPLSAVASGLADFVLPPEEMPGALVNYVRHFYSRSDIATATAAPDVSDHLRPILAFLRIRTKYDFNCYRKKMLLRRIERRMGLIPIAGLPEYLAYLRQSPDEVKQLSRDLFISVTSFFRDPDAYQVLEKEIIPVLLKKELDLPIRVWAPGSATGEEPYSIAMILLEQLAAARQVRPVQIFATDVDEQAVPKILRGIYTDPIAVDVSAGRLARFFTRLDDHTFQVNKQLRESLICSVHNLIADPPFSKLDLVVCRNVLIYLEPEAQQRVIALLHYALNDGGYLFLGSSETIGRLVDLFEPVDNKWRIYRRIGPTRHDLVSFPIVPYKMARLESPAANGLDRVRPSSVAELTQQMLLAAFAPAAVLINRRNEILYYFGPTSRYLDRPTGEPTNDITLLVREGMRATLRAAIMKCIRIKASVAERGVRVKRNGDYATATIRVQPLLPPNAPEGLLLVTFEDEPAAPAGGATPVEPVDESLLRKLEHELQATRDDLQITIEEQEASAAELKAANEEIMSINEDLQSANEELQTSREELQSLNEELTTVNAQLRDKIEELEASANDLANLLNCTDIGTVFLDTSLRIKRFMLASSRYFKFIASDVGRPLGDITQNFQDPALLDDARQVLTNHTPVEREVPTDGDGWCIRRVVPYRTKHDRIDGVVITFIDISERKRNEESLRKLSLSLEQRVQERAAEIEETNRALQTEMSERSRVEGTAKFLAAIVQHSDDAIISQTPDGIITSWNQGAERLYGYSAAEMFGNSIYEIMPAAGIAEQRQIQARVRKGEHIEHFQVRGVRKDGEEILVSVTNSPIHDQTGKVIGISFISRDITKQKQMEKEVLEITTEGQRRIGQDLHDSVGQELTGLGLMAEDLKETLEKESSPHRPLAERIAAGLRLTLGQVRALSRGLIPVEVDADGLMVALQDLAARVSDQSKISCRFECAQPVAVEDNFRATHLFRIAQEAVTNALKHSGARRIQIRLDADREQIVLQVADDGDGMPKQAAESAGMGLRIMRYRASLINGQLATVTEDGQGTTVTCSIPKEDNTDGKVEHA